MELGFIVFVGIGVLVSCSFTYFVAHTAERYHKEHPICDVNAVVAELEEYKYSHLVERDSERCEHCKEEEKNCDGNDCFLCVWDKAIEIVRKGGAE